MRTLETCRLFQISDCHYSASDPNAKKRLIWILEHIEQQRATYANTSQKEHDILLITGDLVCDPTQALYGEFKQVIESCSTFSKIYTIPGNHDCRTLMARAFKDSRLHIKSKIRLSEHCQVLLCDSSDKPLSDMALGSGRLSERTLQFLKKETRKKSSLVVVHHPIENFGADWIQTIGIENHVKVRQSIHPQTLAVISGHAHQYFETNVQVGSPLKGVPQLVSPATCYGFNHQIPEYQRTATIGYMVYEVNKLRSSPQFRHCSFEFEADVPKR